jgi:hypothetical protein
MALLDLVAGPGQWRLDLFDSLNFDITVMHRMYLLERNRVYLERRAKGRTEAVRKARALSRAQTKEFVAGLTKPLRRLYERQQTLMTEIQKMLGDDVALSKLKSHDINMLLTARHQLATLEVSAEKASAKCSTVAEVNHTGKRRRNTSNAVPSAAAVSATLTTTTASATAACNDRDSESLRARVADSGAALAVARSTQSAASLSASTPSIASGPRHRTSNTQASSQRHGDAAGNLQVGETAAVMRGFGRFGQPRDL